MKSHTVGFVGGGRITAIFLQALGRRGLALDRVTVSDVNADAAACERVFLALHRRR